jgi:nitroreductase
MDALENLKSRRSVRGYLDKDIPRGILEEIVDVARFSPTARNIQPWELIVMKDKLTLKKIAELAENGKFLASANACIAVFCSDTKYYLEDGCSITVNILNAAAALGLGSCWIAGDKKPYCDEIKRMLGAPNEFRLVSLISLGYPLDKQSLMGVEKKETDKFVHWEKF